MKKLILSTLVTLILFLSSLFSESETKQEIIEIKAIPIEETTEVIHTQTPQSTLDPYETAILNMQLDMEEIKSIEDKKEWFLAYKDVLFKYKKWIDLPETVFDCFTSKEVDLILKAVETECYDQNFESKCNVASVIFNRIEIKGEFGDSVEEIITRPKQFAYGRDIITEDTILAVMYAWEIEDTTYGCVAFRSKSKPEKWRKWERQFIDDAGHGFYK